MLKKCATITLILIFPNDVLKKVTFVFFCISKCLFSKQQRNIYVLEIRYSVAFYSFTLSCTLPSKIITIQVQKN